MRERFQRHISTTRRLLRIALRQRIAVLMLLFAPIFPPFLFSQTCNVKIENITFPEGNQISYVYNMAQDGTGLIWIRQGRDFYNYNGHKLSRVKQEVMSVPFYSSNKFFAEKNHPFFISSETAWWSMTRWRIRSS